MTQKKLKIGDETSLSIQKLVYQGYGLGFHHKQAIFVPQTLPGDDVQIEVQSKKRRHLFAKKTATHKESPYRTTANCAHYPDCGGCQLQDVHYQDQIKLKDAMMEDCIQSLFPEVNTYLKPIIACENTQFYRNKMEFSFSKDKSLFLGLKKRHHFDTIIKTDTCQLQDTISQSICQTTADFFNTTPLSPWHPKTHEGDLRHLMIRHSKDRNEFMLNLHIAKDVPEILDDFTKHMSQHHPEIVSIYITINPEPSETSPKQELRHVFGQTHLQEALGNKQFLISPRSFFQTNTKQATLLYQTIEDMAALKPSDTLLDLYCGTGSIGLFLADKVKQLIGIEEVPEAIQDAHTNAELNNTQNATFICGRVKNILKFQTFNPSVAIVDPPRSGMVPKALKRMVALNAPSLIYVSCNPTTLLRDLKEITSEGYNIEAIQPVDMFPHTYHIETIVKLRKAV